MFIYIRGSSFLLFKMKPRYFVHEQYTYIKYIKKQEAQELLQWFQANEQTWEKLSLYMYQ